ncbi:MAG: YkvA family protein [Desulfobacterales bacterium]
MLEDLKNKARLLKTEFYAIYLAYKDPRVPIYARIFAVCVVGYTFSPIDLIPDPIPILGYLDDLILVPLGIFLVLKMIPKEVMAEYREQARVTMLKGKPVNWIAAVVFIGIWVGLAILAVAFVSKHFIA